MSGVPNTDTTFVCFEGKALNKGRSKFSSNVMRDLRTAYERLTNHENKNN